MENQVRQLVNKLVEIYDIDDRDLPHALVERFLSSIHQPHPQVPPLQTSLDNIRQNRWATNIKEEFKEICHEVGPPSYAAEFLYLVDKFSNDDSARKFIKIHNLLKVTKERKKQQQRQQRQTQTLENQQSHQSSNQSGYPSATVRPATVHIPSYVHDLQHGVSSLPYDRNIQNSDANFHTPAHPSRLKTGSNHNETAVSAVVITPANYRTTSKPREKSKSRRKNDQLYLKMKTFLSDYPFLSFDFKKIDWSQVSSIQPLNTMTVLEQENALINDLCYVLTGMEGKYIRMQPSRENPHKHTIGVERGGDELIYSAATRIIKICPLYSTVVHFAEDVNFGLVNQALGAPVRRLVKEYLSLISNIQTLASNNEMTLQSMWLMLQSIYYKMEALKQVIDMISRHLAYGGHTLSILHNKITNCSADPRAHEFCLQLMVAACEPYFGILERWLYQGVIEDPFGEFFIEDTEDKTDYIGTSLNNSFFHANSISTMPKIDIDTFWRKRFTRDDRKVPDFLRSKQEKIYDTGKYLSVVRHYGKKTFQHLQYETLSYSAELRVYDEKVEEAYRFASKEVLSLLMDEYELIERLHSLKRLYLFSSGDLFVQFMDLAEDELNKTKDEININQLESFLEQALRKSSCHNDSTLHNVQIGLSDGSLYQMMSSINNTSNQQRIEDGSQNTEYCQSSTSLLGWECINFSCDVSWPLSMIICKDYCQALYQMMFRHLFGCKYIERKLEATWRVNRLFNSSDFDGAFSLRHKMQHFIHTLLYYTIEIIEPSFQILISKFNEGVVENIKEVEELHRAFLSGLVFDSMLTDNELLGLVTKLLLLCMDFSILMEARVAYLESHRPEKPKQRTPLISASNNNINSETEIKSKRPSTLFKSTPDDISACPQEGYVAAQIRKLSLSSSNSQTPTSSKIQKSDSTGDIFKTSIKSKPINNDESFHQRISELDRQFNSKMFQFLDVLKTKSQDYASSNKLMNIYFRLDYNNFLVSVPHSTIP